MVVVLHLYITQCTVVVLLLYIPYSSIYIHIYTLLVIKLYFLECSWHVRHTIKGCRTCGEQCISRSTCASVKYDLKATKSGKSTSPKWNHLIMICTIHCYVSSHRSCPIGFTSWAIYYRLVIEYSSRLMDDTCML